MPKATTTTKATKSTKRPASKKATATTAAKTTPSRNGHRNGIPMGVMDEKTKRLTLRSFQLAYEQHQQEKQNGQGDV